MLGNSAWDLKGVNFRSKRFAKFLLWDFLLSRDYHNIMYPCKIGHLQKEWVIKTSRKPPKGSKFFCLSPASIKFMHNLFTFCRNSKISKYLEIPLIARFLWHFAQQKTSTQSIRIMTSLSRDIPIGQKIS